MKTTVKERPILFSGPEVRAILDGRKTQTRRVLKRTEGNNVVRFERIPDGRFEYFEDRYKNGIETSVGGAYTCPFGTPGSRLWVRETWGFSSRVTTDAHDQWMREQDTTYLVYRADEGQSAARWIPSIHMPRWASRLTLEIVSVRVERLQAISEEDAEAEGADPKFIISAAQFFSRKKTDFASISTYRNGFRIDWDELHEKRPSHGWGANPWCWVVEFRRVED